jgi:hypothetical protein
LTRFLFATPPNHMPAAAVRLDGDSSTAPRQKRWDTAFAPTRVRRSETRKDGGENMGSALVKQVQA